MTSSWVVLLAHPLDRRLLAHAVENLLRSYFLAVPDSEAAGLTKFRQNITVKHVHT